MSNKNLFQLSGFPRAVLGNGLGRYVCQLQRVTIKFCKSSGSSRGVREFIENELIDFAKYNPGIVVYVKPRRHRAPVFVAEYLNGERKWLSATNFNREEVTKWLNLLKNQSGIPEVRLRKTQHTDNPSIQGPWNPFLFRHPSINLAKFPDEKLSACKQLEPSATEKLLKIFKAQTTSNTTKVSVENEKKVFKENEKPDSQIIKGETEVKIKV